jgi:hypothetical protein
MTMDKIGILYREQTSYVYYVARRLFIPEGVEAYIHIFVTLTLTTI